MGEGPCEVRTGGFGAWWSARRRQGWTASGGRGCAPQGEGAHRRGSAPRSPGCPRPFPQGLSVASPFPLLSENDLGRGG